MARQLWHQSLSPSWPPLLRLSSCSSRSFYLLVSPSGSLSIAPSLSTVFVSTHGHRSSKLRQPSSPLLALFSPTHCTLFGPRYMEGEKIWLKALVCFILVPFFCGIIRVFCFSLNCLHIGIRRAVQILVLLLFEYKIIHSKRIPSGYPWIS